MRAHLVALTGLLLVAGQAGAQAPGGGAPAVMVTPVVTQDITNTQVFNGRVKAVDTVELIARVEGFLGPRQFADGSVVQKGDVLFLIEPEAYQAAVDRAEANVASAEATVEQARLNFDRQETLRARGTVAQAVLDEARAQLKEAEAALAGAQAELRAAALDLTYTTIEAPITGRISEAAYSEGAYVGPNSSTLAEIVAQDPMRVAFPVPQEVLLNVRARGRTREDVVLQLRLADGRLYEPLGTIIFSDVRADASTDTIEVTGEFGNPDGLLIDGQLVEVLVRDREPQRRLVVPQAALLLDQQGAFVLTVNAENKVEQTRFEPGRQRGTFIEVASGLEEGTLVIVAGIQKVRPGMTVSPQQANDAGPTEAPAGN